MTDPLEIGVATDVGQVRTENQDHYCVLATDPATEAGRKGTMVVVADGMGGHSGGQVASHTAIDAITETFLKTEKSSLRDILEEAIFAGNRAVREKAQDDAKIRDMGTTCVALLVRGEHVVTAHLGDSRCYMFRGGDAEVVTRDHTYLNQLIDIGLLTPEDAEGHPDKNIITRCVGMSDDLEIEFNHRQLLEGDVFLMCSDGLSNLVRMDEMHQLIGEMAPQEACDRLVAMANDRGGDDNITVAIVRVNTIPAVAEDLAALDRELEYSAESTPVITNSDVDRTVTDDALRPSDVAPDADTEEIPSQSSGESPDLEDTRPITRPDSERRPGRAVSPWYWLIGVEIVLLIVLQFWIDRY